MRCCLRVEFGFLQLSRHCMLGQKPPSLYLCAEILICVALSARAKQAKVPLYLENTALDVDAARAARNVAVGCLWRTLSDRVAWSLMIGID